MKKQDIINELEARSFTNVQINTKGNIWCKDDRGTFIRWIVEGGKLLPVNCVSFRLDTEAAFVTDFEMTSGIVPQVAYKFFFPSQSLN